MPGALKREKREKTLPVKEEIGGESTAKPVFQIKTLGKKNHYERRCQKTDDGDAERNQCGGGDLCWRRRWEELGFGF